MKHVLILLARLKKSHVKARWSQLSLKQAGLACFHKKHLLITTIYCSVAFSFAFQVSTRLASLFAILTGLVVLQKLHTTHVKISQLVASLQTSRQQVVFARLVTSCQQVWNKLLTTFNNLVEIIRFVTRLFQTRLLQSWYNNIATTLCRQPCNILVISWLYQTC